VTLYSRSKEESKRGERNERGKASGREGENGIRRTGEITKPNGAWSAGDRQQGTDRIDRKTAG
jgi:hypothetical protein